MTKPHINDTELFKSVAAELGGYAAIIKLSYVYRLYKSVGIESEFIKAINNGK